MTEDDIKALRQDPDGLISYEYLANNIDSITADELDSLTENMINVDKNGQFLASAARYLQAIDPERFAQAIRSLAAATIDKDREHRYLPDLMISLYGEDYMHKAPQLVLTDNNFRRIFKRLYPKSDSL
ncbi:MAG: hypothetical protein K2L80_05850 [Muribaculaceae bacterium]|nr:hypothetical protein [Muribaculaceae bacterium]MDE6332107.1 hypothetical protein [Muribaculaceae bacterium]